jgi:peptidase E
MPKLYLLGGENVSKRTAREVNERAFQDAGQPLAALVFPWARASFDRMYRKRKVLSDYFISLGAGTVDFIEYSDSSATIAQKIASSNLIYLTGGLVNALVERLRKMGVDDMLRDYDGVVVGRSAGALALCKKCVITGRWNRKARLAEGLGLVDLTLKAHYKPQKDHVLEFLSKREKIYAVPSRSAIVYENGTYSVIGKAYLFENGKKSRLKSFS